MSMLRVYVTSIFHVIQAVNVNPKLEKFPSTSQVKSSQVFSHIFLLFSMITHSQLNGSYMS